MPTVGVTGRARVLVGAGAVAPRAAMTMPTLGTGRARVLAVVAAGAAPRAVVTPPMPTVGTGRARVVVLVVAGVALRVVLAMVAVAVGVVAGEAGGVLRLRQPTNRLLLGLLRWALQCCLPCRAMQPSSG